MYYLAFITGLFGSLHCIGMCGPLALAIPLPKEKRTRGIFIYHLGRTISYVLLGVIFGTMGLAISLSGYQKTLSVLMGTFFLLTIMLPCLSRKVERKIYTSGLIKRLKSSIVNQFKKKTYLSALTVGLLNGFLPCGLVYFAIAGSVVTSNILTGGYYMFCFSLGTIPAMVSVTLIQKIIFKGRNFKSTKFLGFILALVLIYRGIALEIPQLSETMAQIGLGKITGCGR